MTEFYCQAQAQVQVSLALSGSLSGSGLQSGHDLVLVMSLELDS